MRLRASLSGARRIVIKPYAPVRAPEVKRSYYLSHCHAPGAFGAVFAPGTWSLEAPCAGGYIYVCRLRGNNCGKQYVKERCCHLERRAQPEVERSLRAANGLGRDDRFGTPSAGQGAWGKRLIKITYQSGSICY